MQLDFGPFRLDPISQSLWRDGELVPLTRKAFGVLQCLIERRGELVAKNELLARVWPDTVVGEAVLKVCVREIRRALGDDSHQPRFVATAHRRGYRFIAALEPAAAVPAGRDATARGAIGWIEPRRLPSSAIVGREQPLAELRAAFASAYLGARQVVFVTGEAGIGKTTLIDAFLSELVSEDGVWMARGQCPPQHGPGEAYLPLLEALGVLCRRPGGAGFLAELARRAPTWLLQMPALIDEADRARLLAQSLGATPQRMLREMVETLGALATESTLVLVLEDLHWSDPATLDLISALARRREPARLLLLASYRPAEVILHQHPLRALKLDLQLHGYGRELSLEFLAEIDVQAYLRERFGAQVADVLAALAYQRSDGNPLFLESLADHLVTSGVVVGDGDRYVLANGGAAPALEFPASLRQMIERRIERLPSAERMALEAASVAGVEFASTAVAFALGDDVMRTEDLLADLGRRDELLRLCGTDERPDGSVASRLRFVHALYAEVLYDGISPTRRAELHRRIAVGEEASFGDAATQIAALLALHYDRGRDPVHAVKHLRQAAENAARRSSGREALSFLTRALALVPRLPKDERTALDHALRARRGAVRHQMGDLRGAGEEFAILAGLARGSGRPDLEVRALVHQATAVYLIDRAASDEIFARARAASRDLPDRSLAIHLRSLSAYNRLRTRSFSAADRAACSAAVRALEVANESSLLVAHYGRSALFENAVGDYAAARRLSESGLALAIETGDLLEHLLCQYSRGWALLHAGAWREILRGLDEEIELAERNDHPLWAAVFRLQKVWLYVETGAYERAEALCGQVVEVGKRARHGLSQALGLLLLGTARLAAGRTPGARSALHELDSLLASGEVAVEPILRPPLELLRSGTSLACGELDEARSHAEELLALARSTGEPTYQALAHRTLAEIALRQRHPAAAARAIDAALVLLDGTNAPLAAWRVHATAAEVSDARRRRAQARQQWRASAAVLRSLADSLAGAPDLRAELLATPRVHQILARAN